MIEAIRPITSVALSISLSGVRLRCPIKEIAESQKSAGVTSMPGYGFGSVHEPQA